MTDLWLWVAVLVLVLLGSLLAIGLWRWGPWPPRTPSRQREDAEVGTGLRRPDGAGGEPSSGRLHENPLVLTGEDDEIYHIEPVGDEPPGGLSVLAGVNSQLMADVTKMLPPAAKLGGGQWYRLVKAPPGGLQNVAGNPKQYRGFSRQHGKIAGQGAFAKPQLARTLSPTVALAVASAALGHYWQQQLHSTLQEIQGTLNAIHQRLNHELDAKLDLAEQTLAEHEALPRTSRYEPPSSVTDGMQANRVQRKELESTFGRLKQLEGQPLSPGDFCQRAMSNGSQHLEHQVYRALRGLNVELRVLWLKRLGALTEPPGYQEGLEEQAQDLTEELQLVGNVLDTACSLRLSKEHEGRQLELPAQRRRRQEKEQARANKHRSNLRRLRNASMKLETLALPPPTLDQVELYLKVDEDGQARAMMSAPAELEAHDRSPR